MSRRNWPIAAALGFAALLAAVAFSRINVRTDMADFLPSGQTEAARFMLQELRNGGVGSLVLIAVEDAAPEELARISGVMRTELDKSGLFAFVNNGQQGLGGEEQALLFRHRYLLSPATTAEAFTVPALRHDFDGLLQGLSSSAAPLVLQFGLADPPGAAQAMLRDWVGASHIRQVAGVWFAADRDRALLLGKTIAAGMDVTAQDYTVAAIEAAFQATHPASAHVLMSGPPVFAREAAQAIRSDVRLLSIVSAVLIALLLLWRFRSPWVLGVIGVPVLLSIAAAALAVQVAFGFVHGVTLGFGMTMLGVTVDYPVLLIGHRKLNEAPAGTWQRIGPTLVLAVASAALGLTGMLFSGFAGLAQLGLFSVVGIVVAAAATRWILPRLIVAAELAPVYAGDPGQMLHIERFRRWRYLGLLPVLAAVLYLAGTGGPRWEDDLSRLSPVPKAALALDAELRAEIGAPDEVQLLMLHGESAEAVLQHEEKLLPILDALTAKGVMSGAQIAARLVPSQATQLARRAALPSVRDLAARVAEARAGLPFRAEAFQRFQEDVAATVEMAPLLPSDFTLPLIATRLQSLLFQRDGRWFGVIAPSDLRDKAALLAALQPEDVTFVDMKAETDGMVAAYTVSAWHWLAYGCLAAVLALLAGLRDLGRTCRVAGAVLAATVVTVALLTATGTRLSLIHIVSLQLVAGVGLDYALFFARPLIDDEERARTLRTLVTCNAMTLMTFGLLALCRTPLLRDIGRTVVIGVLAAMVFSFLFAGPRPETALQRGR